MAKFDYCVAAAPGDDFMNKPMTPFGSARTRMTMGALVVILAGIGVLGRVQGVHGRHRALAPRPPKGEEQRPELGDTLIGEVASLPIAFLGICLYLGRIQFCCSVVFPVHRNSLQVGAG